LIPFPAGVEENYSGLSTLNSCFTTKQAHPDKQEGSSAAKKGDKSPTSSDFCFPSVLIAGFPKCGTSFLFHALSTHPNILPTRRKELCLGGPLSETWPKMVSFLPSIADTKATGGQRVMTGCLHLGANIRAAKELCALTANIKVIFLVRDVADMLWAAYNYWCNVDTDGPSCFPGEHTYHTIYILGAQNNMLYPL
jgi:hypothetical protein